MTAEQRPSPQSDDQCHNREDVNARQERSGIEARATTSLTATRNLSFQDETRHRMHDLGTDDPGEAIVDLFTPYLIAHALWTPDEQANAREQGRAMRMRRQELCLDEDDV